MLTVKPIYCGECSNLAPHQEGLLYSLCDSVLTPAATLFLFLLLESKSLTNQVPAMSLTASLAIIYQKSNTPLGH